MWPPQAVHNTDFFSRPAGTCVSDSSLFFKGLRNQVKPTQDSLSFDYSELTIINHQSDTLSHVQIPPVLKERATKIMGAILSFRLSYAPPFSSSFCVSHPSGHQSVIRGLSGSIPLGNVNPQIPFQTYCVRKSPRGDVDCTLKFENQCFTHCPFISVLGHIESPLSSVLIKNSLILFFQLSYSSFDEEFRRNIDSQSHGARISSMLTVTS